MHLIVGLDTGKTSAFVCLNLDGHMVQAGHKTFAGVEWLIDAIGRTGVPSIIACDKEPNEVARKVCAAFNAKLFYPQKMISIEEKRNLAKPHGIKNQHERDAYSAAIKAYNAHANKLNQAEHVARAMNANDIDAIKAKIIEKYSMDEALSNKAANRR